MKDRIQLMNSLYSSINEDARLCKSRAGELEYFTTLHFIHQHLKEGHKILEVGAGTGRYSITLANEGYDVTAVELVDKNLEVLNKNKGCLKNIQAFQGDALDLSRFEDNSFDITLVLGPMYHLFSQEEKHKAIDEAIRVTKKGGMIFFAFLSIHGILWCNYLQGNFQTGLDVNFDKDFKPKSFVEQCFTGFQITDFEALFKDKNTEHITTVATDGIMELAQKRSDFKMTDHDFKQFLNYHINFCQQRELLGSSSHLLYICKKREIL